MDFWSREVGIGACSVHSTHRPGIAVLPGAVHLPHENGERKRCLVWYPLSPYHILGATCASERSWQKASPPGSWGSPQLSLRRPGKTRHRQRLLPAVQRPLEERFSTSKYLHPGTRSQRSARVTAHRLSHPAGLWDTASGPPTRPQQTCDGRCPSANGSHRLGFLWPCSRLHSTEATWSPRGWCLPFWGVCLQEGGLGTSLLRQGEKGRTVGAAARRVPRPLQRSPLWEIPSFLHFQVLVDGLVLAAEGGIRAGRQAEVTPGLTTQQRRCRDAGKVRSLRPRGVSSVLREGKAAAEAGPAAHG
ncbi:uncharacterized protein LOC111151774 [Enhydra lutris kenyoni]|uniref:Uncharacterized protein LOC111151774 n=1 Tax=Enhydra lutris kenyoni TaxID=391180 RepID=A0A2Y9K857_ENHLU|nr:uncharacterized protein LOC111151774 [Enhydra lutris kenyoni]